MQPNISPVAAAQPNPSSVAAEEPNISPVAAVSEASAGPDSTRAQWDLSAKRYAAFASRSGLYRNSAEVMVARADIEPGQVVVDLACGTGVVSEAILRRPEGERVELIAVDFSEGMLGMARQRLRAGNISFRRGRAEELGQLVTKPVDRLFCHAAFWQFDETAVLGELGRTLAPSGRCFISIPESPFRRIDFRALHHLNKPIWMAIEEARLRGYPVLRGRRRGAKDSHPATVGQAAPPGAQATRPPRPDTGGDGYFDHRLKEAIATGTGEHGLRLSRIDPIVVDVRPEEYVEFLNIPVMARDVPFFAGVEPGRTAGHRARSSSNELEWTADLRPLRAMARLRPRAGMNMPSVGQAGAKRCRGRPRAASSSSAPGSPASSPGTSSSSVAST